MKDAKAIKHHIYILSINYVSTTKCVWHNSCTLGDFTELSKKIETGMSITSDMTIDGILV